MLVLKTRVILRRRRSGNVTTGYLALTDARATASFQAVTAANLRNHTTMTPTSRRCCTSLTPVTRKIK